MQGHSVWPLALACLLLAAAGAVADDTGGTLSTRSISNTTDQLLRETEELLSSQQFEEEQEAQSGSGSGSGSGGGGGGGGGPDGSAAPPPADPAPAPSQSSQPQELPPLDSSNPVFAGMNGEGFKMPDPITGEGSTAGSPMAQSASPGAEGGQGGQGDLGMSSPPQGGGMPPQGGAPSQFQQGFKKLGSFPELEDFMGSNARFRGSGGQLQQSQQAQQPQQQQQFQQGQQFQMPPQFQQQLQQPGAGAPGQPQQQPGAPPEGMGMGMPGDMRGMRGMPPGMPPGMRGPGYGSRFATQGMPGLPQQFGGIGGEGAGAGGFNGAGAAGAGAGSSGAGMGVAFPAPVGGEGRGGTDGVPPPPSGYSLLDEASSVAVRHRDAPNPLEGIYGRDGGENGAVAAAGGGLPSVGDSSDGWSRTLPYDGGPAVDDGEGIGKARDPDGGKMGVEADTGADADADGAAGADGGAPGQGAAAPKWDRKQEVNKELEWERAHEKEIEEEDQRLLSNFQSSAGAGDEVAPEQSDQKGQEQGEGGAPGQGADGAQPGGEAEAAAPAPQGGSRGLRGGKQLSFDEAEALMSRLQAKHRGGDRKRSSGGDGGSMMRFAGRGEVAAADRSSQPPTSADVDFTVAKDRLERPIGPNQDGPGTGRPMSVGEEQAENEDVATEEVVNEGRALTEQDEQLNEDAEEEQKAEQGADVDKWLADHPIRLKDMPPALQEDGRSQGDGRLYNSVGTGKPVDSWRAEVVEAQQADEEGQGYGAGAQGQLAHGIDDGEQGSGGDRLDTGSSTDSGSDGGRGSALEWADRVIRTRPDPQALRRELEGAAEVATQRALRKRGRRS